MADESDYLDLIKQKKINQDWLTKNAWKQKIAVLNEDQEKKNIPTRYVQDLISFIKIVLRLSYGFTFNSDVAIEQTRVLFKMMENNEVITDDWYNTTKELLIQKLHTPMNKNHFQELIHAGIIDEERLYELVWKEKVK